MSVESFSRRYGHRETAQEIVVRNEAPANLRAAILAIAEEVSSPHTIRNVVCKVLRCLPDPSNWSAYPNVWDEVQGLVLRCKWYKVYDLVEALYACLYQGDSENAAKFLNEVNLYFVEEGVGWQLTEQGTIEMRGSDAFETTIMEAERQLKSAGQMTASSEIREAIRDLSRRPDPDLTGAVQHSMAALECIAREACGDSKATR